MEYIYGRLEFIKRFHLSLFTRSCYNSRKMRVVALISGGKDSLYNAILAKAEGHEVNSLKCYFYGSIKH